MAEIHPSAVIDKSAQIDNDVVIGPNCYVGPGAVLGPGTVLEPAVIIEKNVVIGRNNHFFPHCVIGANPQVLAMKEGAVIGKLVIGDNNTFHEQVTIHPSIYSEGRTRIGNDNFIMIGTHIGHDCIIDDRVVLSNYVQISGHCHIEDGVWLSGMVLSHQFVTMGKWCYCAGMAGINKDIPPYLIVSGHYPPVVRSVNKRGMVRAGLSEEQQAGVLDAYKQLYRQGGSLLENAKALAKTEGLDENVRAMVESVIRSAEHRYGRYLETLRH